MALSFDQGPYLTTPTSGPFLPGMSVMVVNIISLHQLHHLPSNTMLWLRHIAISKALNHELNTVQSAKLCIMNSLNRTRAKPAWSLIALNHELNTVQSAKLYIMNSTNRTCAKPAWSLIALNHELNTVQSAKLYIMNSTPTWTPGLSPSS